MLSACACQRNHAYTLKNKTSPNRKKACQQSVDSAGLSEQYQRGKSSPLHTTHFASIEIRPWIASLGVPRKLKGLESDCWHLLCHYKFWGGNVGAKFWNVYTKKPGMNWRFYCTSTHKHIVGCKNMRALIKLLLCIFLISCIFPHYTLYYQANYLSERMIKSWIEKWSWIS